MKSHGIKRLIVIMILSALLGGGIGFLVGKIISGTDFSPLLVQCKDQFVQWFLPIAVVVAVVIVFISFYTEKKTEGCLAALEKAEDEEADRLEEKAGKYSSVLILINGCVQILAILCIGELIDYYLVRQVSEAFGTFFWQVIAAGTLSLTSTYFSIHHFNVIKAHYNKDGDPGEKDWAEKYFNSLDEAEQMSVYKGYKKTTETGYKVLILLMCLTLFSNALFHTGTFATVVLAMVYCVMQFTYQRSVRNKGGHNDTQSRRTI